ncbi:Antiseptic resistance protein [Sinobacterium norvegicum]|uniref:Antiseptic resistance protein n=1 Tax=Sinobacterium norvegicum TaxID=1641715 RepID=A0ABN8ENA0_9GAMM|nr:MFS transporter [Sinobacterium norvegicum]CAH0992422.1 Antiseptic resistance protein [Sinobacterium norvegicum]
MGTSNNNVKANKKLLLLVLCLAQFSLSADIANLSISTSALVSAFNTDINQLQIAGTIYPLVGGAFMLIAGMLGLFIGWRRLLIIGCGFGVASVALTLSANNINVISYGARSLAGLAGACILPAALALVVAHYPGPKRAIGFGAMAASTGIAAALIPAISGYLADNFSWYWSFSLIGTLYTATLICAIFFIAPLHSPTPKRFDYLGSLLGATGIILTLFGLLKAPRWGFIFNKYASEPSLLPSFLQTTSPALLSIIAGIIVLYGFIRWERRFEAVNGSALFPTRWLSNSALLRGLGILTILYMLLGGFSFTLIAYLQIGVELSASHSGVIILLFAISMITFSILTPMLPGELSPKQLSIIAFTILFFASVSLWLSSSPHHVNALIYPAMFAVGIGIGMLASQAPIIITQAAGEQDAAQSGGIQATVRNIGTALGISIMAGGGQLTLESYAKQQIADHPEIHRSFKAIVQETVSLPYIDTHSLTQYLETTELDDTQRETVLDINAEARWQSFSTSIRVMGVITFLGLLIAFRLTGPPLSLPHNTER